MEEVDNYGEIEDEGWKMMTAMEMGRAPMYKIMTTMMRERATMYEWIKNEEGGGEVWKMMTTMGRLRVKCGR